MADYYATLRTDTSRNNVPISSNAPVFMDATIEVPAGADEDDKFIFQRLPKRARLHGFSLIAWDDLSDSGSPVIDVGLRDATRVPMFNPTALLQGIDVSVAPSTALALIADHASWGKTVRELMGTSGDAQFAEIVVSSRVAALATAGTISISVGYSVD